MPRYQARGLGRSPALNRRGACLLIPRTLVFRDGYPAPPGDANREGTAFRGRGKTTLSFLSSHTILRRACCPLPTSCNATRGSRMPLARGCPAFPWSERSRRFRQGREPPQASQSERWGRGGGNSCRNKERQAFLRARLPRGVTGTLPLNRNVVALRALSF